MKKSILIAAILLSLTTLNFSQWNVVPAGTSQYLMDVFFINANTGWVVGYSSTMYKTTDGGTNWTQIQVPITQNLISVFFIDENTGWVTGSQGGIIKTTNGGNDWVVQSSGVNYQIESICFTNENNGYAVVNDWTGWRYGAILQTTNGGQNWITKVGFEGYGMIDIQFPDQNAGYAVGSSGLIWKTTDSGNSWDYMFFSDIWLHSVFFINDRVGWIAGGSLSSDFIIKTTNNGNSWFEVRQTNENALLSGIYFIDEENGWACGDGGTIIKTTDGGITWINETTNVQHHLQEFSFIEDQGYCVGVSGTILKYKDSPINISQPNGGEIITAGSEYEILWSSTDVTDVKIEFSSNNGQDWITVIDSIPSIGIYDWIVPSVLSDQCRIRIIDLSDPDIFDMSYAAFTIESSKIINILQPNGGEIIPGGQYYEILWNSNDVEYVKLEYSINNGASWNSITDSAQSVGIYQWQVPNIQTIQGKIKITDISEPVIKDISDNPFRIDFSVGVGPESQVLDFSLSQNYPNPFNPLSVITFSIPNQEFVTLKVYDMLGIEVAALVNEELTAGYYTVEFDSKGLSSGTYFYRIQAGKFSDTKKMILLK